MKYIDADHLQKEVKRLERAAHKSALDCADSETRKFHEGKALAYQFVGILIDSLQQEQPEQKKNCAECPHCVDRKDQYGWHFKGCFGGPYKGKFIAEIDECPLKQEQPEVDLEKEIERFLESEESTSHTNAGGYDVAFKDTVKIARHFYELGRNAKEEEK